jgi:hypothetical protein
MAILRHAQSDEFFFVKLLKKEKVFAKKEEQRTAMLNLSKELMTPRTMENIFKSPNFSAVNSS